MAVIQMLNEQVHDVTENAEEVELKIRRRDSELVQLTVVDDHGGGPIYINPNAISSFV